MKKQITIILIGVITLISCNSKNTENGIINQAFLENVKTVKAVLSNQEQELLLTGKVETDPDRIISYVPLISGIVEKTHFSLGDKVRKGQPLLDMRSTELSALQAEKTTLEAEEKVAERELKTAQSLFEDKMLSEQELLEAKAKLQQIRAELSRIKSDMNMYGADKGNGIFTVHAPMSGYIIHKKASPGTMISPESDEVFTIADLSTVWVIANVYASNLLCVREGMDVEMTTFSYPNEKFHGKINALSQIFDPEERVLKARIVMDNKDLRLKPEMSMLITLKDKTAQYLIAIPSDALIFDNNQYFVVVEESMGSFAIRNVIPQGYNNKTSYIASGLLEGESVVVKNQLLIYSGLKEE
ncbi:MAG: efflux RND transporter periplasmic adaptor subunit [Bacteroidetes bacterium]|nr:efflux RND transporter periplasmic adaptor subunit [Bacteroidota bacterium]MCL2301686.1 efflux RND transporter periplasmic adaptor subunit [Lentimicrobiaceae bacterium]